MSGLSHQHDAHEGSLIHTITMGDTGAPLDARVKAELEQLLGEIRDSQTLAPITGSGAPYAIAFSTSAEGLRLEFVSKKDSKRSEVTIPLAPLRRHLADYSLICESFYNAAKSGDIHRLEAVDAGRRGVHDDGAAELADLTEGKLRLDKPTARRLFSLLYILSKRQTALL